MIYYTGDGPLTPVATDPKYEVTVDIDDEPESVPRSSSQLPRRSGSRTSVLNHVTGHRSASVGVRPATSGVRATHFASLESQFGSTVGSGTRVCRDELWHGFGTNRSGSIPVRVAAPTAWPSTLLSARLSVVPVCQQSSDVTGTRPVVARCRGVSVTSPEVAATPMDEWRISSSRHETDSSSVATALGSGTVRSRLCRNH